MRIEIPANFKGKNYKFKTKEHITFDIEDCNVAEFYLTNVNFDAIRFMNKWPTVSFRLLTNSFEYFATNDLLTGTNKYNSFMLQNNRQRRAIDEFQVNDDMQFYVNLYNNPELTGDKIIVTFIENEFAEALLGLSPIGYENEQGKIEMRPAYREDLSRDTMSKEEKRKWEYRFSKMRNKLESELRKAKRRKW